MARIKSIVVRRDALNVYRGLHETNAPQTLRDMFRPRSAVSTRTTRATAAGAAVLELPGFRLATDCAAALSVPGRRLLERAAITCHQLHITIATLAVYVGLRFNWGAWHYERDVRSRVPEIFNVFLLCFMCFMFLMRFMF